jgi:HlyD family secretion protein
MPPMSPRARWIWSGLLVVALALAGFFWQQRGQESDRAFVVAEVSRQAIEEIVTATGTLNAVTTVAVGTYVSGPIQEIHVDFNSPVKRGEVVARIDPDPFAVKVKQADATLATAHARVRKAIADRDFRRLDFKRKKTLVDGKVGSQDALDAIESLFHQAEAQVALERAGVAQAEAGLEEARINLRRTEIVSPVDGVVLSRNVDVGQTVAASFQTPTLFLIAEDLTQMRVIASISESDIGRIETGQVAEFSVDAYPERTFVGSVSQRRYAPIIESNVVTYDVVIDVENPGLELKPGMTATVAITTDSRDETLVVPLRALRFRPEERDRSPGADPESESADRAAASSVWVLAGEGGLRFVAVETGIRNDRHVEIVSGELAVGDRLAVAYERE